MTSNLYKSKKGAAAFYVVIFTTLLLSVITMSFIRIMLSEATKSTNDDLSKSAYDSALAGLEDAKIALVRYHQCLDQGEKANQSAPVGTCGYIIWTMQHADCDTVAMVLGRNGSNKNKSEEVLIQEGKYGSANQDSIDMEQAYTCVKISEHLPDYRSFVSDSNRVRIVPLRSEDIASIKAIRFKWFAISGHEGYTANGSKVYGSTDALVSNSSQVTNKYIPPVVVDFYQTDDNFNIGELSINNDNNNGTDRVSLFLKPTAGTGAGSITTSNIFNKYSHKADNQLAEVGCGYKDDFMCQTIIELPPTYNGANRDSTTALLRIELPYGGEEADFSIELCRDTACNDRVPFVGVQAQVDSTGRANDLFRRVDARVELIDTNFPFPEFAVQLEGDSDSKTNKNFWVTKNCWHSNLSDEFLEDEDELATGANTPVDADMCESNYDELD